MKNGYALAAVELEFIIHELIMNHDDNLSPLKDTDNMQDLDYPRKLTQREFDAMLDILSNELTRAEIQVLLLVSGSYGVFTEKDPLVTLYKFCELVYLDDWKRPAEIPYTANISENKIRQTK
ncbi:hypothetical protein TKK_0011542 [Trichogramma kaykai]